ncbi:MAG TPA: aspartyl protease family protein [Rhodanobacteraceae bacterium]|nr:aspartyl protease family protein [Rhodanobacteraceae bacterium]
MKTRTTIALGLVLGLVTGATLAADPAAILRANKAATGGDAWNGKATLRVQARLTGQGLTGTDTSISDLSDGRNVDHYTLGPASGASGYDGKQAWDQDPSGTVNIESGGDALPLAINAAYRNANLWWRPDFGGATVKDEGQKTAGGRTYDVLTFTPKGGKPFQAWFDSKTHLLMRMVERHGSQDVTELLSDYRPLEGAQIPYKLVVDSGLGAKYLQTVTVTAAQFLSEQSASVYAAPKGIVNDFSIEGGAAQTQFPIHLYNNHIYADASVNGSAPMNFIFDTGGHNILVPSTAKALGIKTEGAMPGTGVGNKAQDYGLAKIKALKVGDATFRNQVVGVLDFEPNGVEGVDIHGMVGFEVFKRFVTRIDYGAHTITLINPKRFDPKDAGTPIKFVFNGDLPEVQGSFEGIPAQFDIDTGARDEITLTAPFVQAHDLRAKHPKGVEAVEGWGVGGASRGYVTRGAELMIGPVKIPGVVTSLSTQKKGSFADASYQGNIGGGVLKRFVVTFDYAHQIMYLKPLPEPVADVGTFDRSGMWINAAKDGLQVMDVTANGPAQSARLEVGDVITQVDGKPAASIPLYELRRQWRDEEPGTQVELTVKRGSATRAATITLRDQI